MRSRGGGGRTEPGGGALGQARLRGRGTKAQAGQLQPGIQRPAPSASRGPSNSLQEPAEAGGLQVSLVNIHTRPTASAIRLSQAVGQLYHPETGGRGPRRWGAVPGGALAPWLGVGLPVRQTGWGPGGGRQGRGFRSPWAPWALIVRGDAGDLETTLLLAPTHGPWGSGFGQGGRGVQLGLLERAQAPLEQGGHMAGASGPLGTSESDMAGGLCRNWGCLVGEGSTRQGRRREVGAGAGFSCRGCCPTPELSLQTLGLGHRAGVPAA